MYLNILKANTEIDRLTAELATATTRATDLQAQVDTLTKSGNDLLARVEQERKDYETQSAEWQKQIAAKDAQLAEMQAEVAKVKTEVGKAANQMAVEKVQACGLKEPVAEEPNKENGGMTIAEQFQAITDPKAKVEFFQKHEAELRKAARLY